MRGVRFIGDGDGLGTSVGVDANASEEVFSVLKITLLLAGLSFSATSALVLFFAVVFKK